MVLAWKVLDVGACPTGKSFLKCNTGIALLSQPVLSDEFGVVYVRIPHSAYGELFCPGLLKQAGYQAPGYSLLSCSA